MKGGCFKQEQRTADSITFMVSLFRFSEDQERPLHTRQPDEVLCITVAGTPAPIEMGPSQPLKGKG